MKILASWDKLGLGTSSHWTQDYWMRLRNSFGYWSERIGNPLNWSILVSGGKESKCDSVSSGEQKQNRVNRIVLEIRLICGDWVQLSWLTRNYLERYTIDRDSRVGEDQKVDSSQRVPFFGYGVGRCEASTHNSKYF